MSIVMSREKAVVVFENNTYEIPTYIKVPLK